jgi:RNA polymerase sigma factor (sigma-70 family)
VRLTGARDTEPLPHPGHERPVPIDRDGPRGEGSDETLWRAAANGDDGAFALLYERHARAIYNYLFRRLADWSEAEDLTAVVFVEAFRRRREVVVMEGKVLPWLYGVATNVLRNRRRTQWRNRRLLTELARDQSGASESDLQARLEAAEQMRSVLQRVGKLPRSQQEVVALCLWSGLSYSEAAAALGVPVGTVRSRLSRARAALAELAGPSRHTRSNPEPQRMVER